MIHNKTPVTAESWPSALNGAVGFLQRHEGFLLAGYPDADALGSMLSLALYLKALGKRPYIVWPGPLIGKTGFLEDILQHNRVPLVAGLHKVAGFTGRVDALIFCDTANRKLVPFYKEIHRTFLEGNAKPVLELDHHFGTDSEPIHEHGLHLFRPSNATAEIAAEVLEACFRHNSGGPDPFAQRNIVISLLTGLIADTGGGRAPMQRGDYEYWVQRLGGRLTANTHEKEDDPESPHFSNPDEIRGFLAQLSDVEKAGVARLQEKIVRAGDVAWLDLLMDNRRELVESLKLNPTAWAQILETMANAVPEVAGRIGLLFYRDESAEGGECFYIKMRRAQEEQCDLREAEGAIHRAFGADRVLGGGGHPGAVSFRIRLMDEAQFLEGIERLAQNIDGINDRK